MKARTLIVPSVVTMAALMRANTCGPTGTSGSAGVRLALTLGAGVRAPVYVQVTSEDDQPGWVRLTRMESASIFASAVRFRTAGEHRRCVARRFRSCGTLA